MHSNKKDRYHYVYYSYEEWGRGYIGSRSCDCIPEKDTNYFGSFTDKTFKPKNKIILQEFNCRKDAFKFEAFLHEFYQVHINKHFANRAKLTTTGFSRLGIKLSRETREKMSKSAKGRIFSLDTREKIKKSRLGKSTSRKQKEKARETCKNRIGNKNPMFGKPLSLDHKLKISESNKGRELSKNTREKMSFSKKKEKNPMYGKKRSEHHFYGKKHSDETKKRMKKANKGKGWFTDGVNNVRCLECPEGYYKGRTISSHKRKSMIEYH